MDANGAPDSCVLKLKGLPYSTTQQQVLDFFSGFRIRSVAFVREADGRPSGLAMQKNGEYIGSRYVKLLHVPKREMEEQVHYGTAAIPKPGKPSMGAAALQGILSPSSMHQHPFCGGLHQALGQAGMGLYTGVPLGWGTSEVNQMPFLANARTILLNQPAAPSEMRMGTYAVQVPSSNTSIHDDGSTIKIRGLPFRASVDNIVDFFEGYDVIRESVYIGRDSSGRPTGDGWVSFTSEGEARRAAREKNKKYLQHRYLELSHIKPKTQS